MAGISQSIKKKAIEIGFDRVGITSAELPSAAHETLKTWLAQGYEGSMDYMARDPIRRADPKKTLPDAKSVICLALNYYQGPVPDLPRGHGRIARYAWGRDYHKVIEKKLKSLSRVIIELGSPQTIVKSYVDYGPILERSFAAQAGLGFIGKNSMLISPGLGSFTFLATLITNLELEFDLPIAVNCGTCNRCIEACPTDAIITPGEIDSRRCISYLTIEARPNEEIPSGVKPLMGDWVFGCDICQDVCPFNRKAPITKEIEFLPESGVGPSLALDGIRAIENDEEFRNRFKGTPIQRAKRAGLQRSSERLLAGSAELGRPVTLGR